MARDPSWRRVFEDALFDRLLDSRSVQRGTSQLVCIDRAKVLPIGRDVAVRFDFTLAGIRVGQFTLRLSRIADAIVRLYGVDRTEAAFRAAALARAIWNSAANHWLEQLTLDDHLTRKSRTQPELVYDLLQHPIGLKSAPVQRLLLDATNPATVDRITRIIDRGLRGRPGYERNKGGRPKRASRAEVRRQFFGAIEALRSFHQHAKKAHNPRAWRQHLCAAHPEIAARLDAAAVLSALLPERRQALPSLEQMAARLIAAERQLAVSTVLNYARNARRALGEQTQS